MAQVILNPYIFFRGDCQEAMEFYKSVFGGEFSTTGYEDVPGDFPGKAELKGKLMHASLVGEVRIMGSDTAEASPEAKKISLSLSGDDETKLRGYFEGLSEGGTVVSPLKQEAWGDTFGSLTDRFGIDWMVNIAKAGD